MNKEEFYEELKASVDIVWPTDIDLRKPWDEPCEMVPLDLVMRLVDDLKL